MSGYQQPQANTSEQPANINEENFVENFEFSPTDITTDYQHLFKTSCDDSVNDDYNIF